MAPLLPVVQAEQTIPQSMPGRNLKDVCFSSFPRGICDREGWPGSGSPLYYINTWAMIWLTDYPMVSEAAL